jgi:hypothetical protein
MILLGCTVQPQTEITIYDYFIRIPTQFDIT